MSDKTITVTLSAKDFQEGNPEMPENLIWGAVKLILSLDRNANDFESKLKGIVKRLVHYQKKDLCSRIKWWADMGDKKWLIERLDEKIKTHDEWSKLSDQEVWTSK